MSGARGGRLALQAAVGVPRLELAVFCTLTYTDLFDYPLTAAEVHRYLIGLSAPAARVNGVLGGRGWLAGHIRPVGEFWVLAGREHLADLRRYRAGVAAGLWPLALRYGRIIAGLPFVRMVAVTGALALDNVEPGDDIDYLVVTAPGRLWVCRALVIGVVRWAARRGVRLCPNYFLSERALRLEDRNLFTAHELAQMVPLFGLDIYQKMRRLNPWTARFLPNAGGPPRNPPVLRPPSPLMARLLEAAGRSPLGGRLEAWEMGRKLRKFGTPRGPEVHFGPDHCQGHFDGHGRRTLAAFVQRLAVLLEGGF